jgi:hypothetical protein
VVPVESLAAELRALLNRAEEANRQGNKRAEDVAMDAYFSRIEAGVTSRPPSLAPLTAESLQAMGRLTKVD